jgi:hypothetical protein
MNTFPIGRFLIATFGLALAAPLICQAQQPPVSAERPKICVVTPDVQLGGGASAGGDPAAPVMTSLVTYLSGPVAEVIPLQARVSVQINAEASQLGCTHIVDTSVKKKKASNGLGLRSLFSAAPALASAVPFMGGGSAGTYAAASVASAAAQEIADTQQQETQEDIRAAMTGVAQNNVKKGDEIELKYELFRPGVAAPIVSGQLKAKAEDNGQDILSPLIEQTANEVLTAAMAPDR